MSKLTKYEIFVAVAEEGSITDAASRLNMSAPAVSKQLVRFEHDLQVQLFHRSHKQLDITEAGNNFYPKCKEILSAIAQAEGELSSRTDTVKGRISITLSKALCRSNIPHILSNFQKKHPRILFDILYSDNLEDLHGKNIDFAFRLGKLKDSSHMVALPLIETRLVACATPKYLQLNGIPESFSDLGKAKLILISPLNASQELRKFLLKEKVNLKNTVSHTTNDIEGVYQLVCANLGIGIMLDISIRRELEEGIFKSILAERNLPRKQLYLLSKNSQWKEKKYLAFKEHIKDSFLNGNNMAC